MFQIGVNRRGLESGDKVKNTKRKKERTNVLLAYQMSLLAAETVGSDTSLPIGSRQMLHPGGKTVSGEIKIHLY